MPHPTCAICTPSRRSSTRGWSVRAEPRLHRPASIFCRTGPRLIWPAGTRSTYSPMSELAVRDRYRRQGWAAPGGLHDRLIRVLKLALPALIGLLMAYLATAPLTRRQEISFIL